MTSSHYIKIYSALDIDPMTCPINEGLNAEDLVISLCRTFKINPVARHLFSLCIHDSNEWINPMVKLIECSSKEFDFRLRFKIPSFSNIVAIDKEAYNYYFNQARNDLIRSKISYLNYTALKPTLLGLAVADMARVILETGKPKEVIEKDYRSYIPDEVYKEHYSFMKQPIKKKLNCLLENSFKGGKKLDPHYIKNHYLMEFETIVPYYLCEEYKASIEEEGFHRGVRIHINPYDKELPGIKYLYEGQKTWTHVCAIEDLCFIIMGNGNTMHIHRKNGIPIFFKFTSLENMNSLLSLLDGYYRLGVKWTYNLSNDLVIPSLNKQKALNCHGPVGGLFAYKKLARLCSNKKGCYILRESEHEYSEYYLDVCLENKKDPTTYKIKRSPNSLTGWVLNEDSKIYKSVVDVLVDLHKKKILNICLHPSENDISPLLLCKVESIKLYNYKEEVDDDRLMKKLVHNPQYIHQTNLQMFGTGIGYKYEGRISKVQRGIWNLELRERRIKKIDIAYKVFNNKYNKEDQLELMGKWASVKCSSLVKLYGFTTCKPQGLVMELLPLGPLDNYLKQHGTQVTRLDMIEAAKDLANALWRLEENKLVHGHICCNKLLVAKHTSTSFVVKLSDPGFSRQYEPHEIHWLDPNSNATNSSNATHYSDVWAFGTTLWEIFSYGEKPSNAAIRGYNANSPQQDPRELYKKGCRLKKPNGCLSDIYGLMLKCWLLREPIRKKAQEAMRDLNYIFHSEYNYKSQINSYSVIKPNIQSKPPAESSIPATVSSLTSLLTGGPKDVGDSSCSTVLAQVSQEGDNANLMKIQQDIESGPDCNLNTEIEQVSECDEIDKTFDSDSSSEDNLMNMQLVIDLGADGHLIYKSEIGQGFYGVVYLADIDNGIERKEVAVKKLKHGIKDLENDFLREIQLVKNFHHRNVVSMKTVYNLPEICLIMDYYPHGSLKNYVKFNGEHIPESEMLTFAHDIASGMDYLGKQNIVHRDLAARNILVVNKYQVKISDFGLAQEIGKEDYYFTKSVRPLPMKWYAPETLRFNKHSTRSDVWSYGVTLFEMFSYGLEPNLQPNSETLIELAEVLESGKRLPCPETCSPTIYSKLMLPCWRLDSHSRPTFNELALEISVLPEYCSSRPLLHV